MVTRDVILRALEELEFASRALRGALDTRDIPTIRSGLFSANETIAQVQKNIASEHARWQCASTPACQGCIHCRPPLHGDRPFRIPNKP